MPPLPPRFQPSGLNNHFTGPYPSFTDYIADMRNIIAKTRVDLADSTQRDWIIDSNAPFEMRPPTWGQGPRRGVLLVHGLSGSPFVMRDMGEHFCKQGFLVRGILLPGHGTRSGDLLKVRAEDWQASIRYGIESFQGEVDELYLAGLSLGGVLCLDAALQGAPCHGLILLAPSIKIKSRFAKLALLHRYFSWISERAKWLATVSDGAYTKYATLTFNAVAETQKIIQRTMRLAQHKTLNVPLFMALSEDDETIDSKAAMNYFSKLSNSHNQLLFYMKQVRRFIDPRIQARISSFPEQNVIDFSHHCLPVSPENAYYGAQGTYADLVHYKFYPKLLQKKGLDQPPLKGAITLTNLQKYHIQRLSYNPDFVLMMAEIDRFLHDISGY